MSQSNNHKESEALHFFLYLLAYVSLVFVALGAGSILFAVINKYVPDPLTMHANLSQGGARFGIAALIVASPIFYVVMGVISKKIKKGLIPLDSFIKKWLTYILLIAAIVTLMGDLIGLITGFLNGDLAMRFILKSFVVFVIAGGIAGFFFWDIRRKSSQDKNKIYRNSFIVSLVFIISVFIGSFFVVDTPKEAREKRIDSRTESALYSLESSLRSFYFENESLPDDLSELSSTQYKSLTPIEIEYNKLGEREFELCANFLSSTKLEGNELASPYVDRNWEHGEGRECFKVKISKEEAENAKLRYRD